MDDDTCADTGVALRLVEEMGMDHIKLDDPPRDLRHDVGVDAEAEAVCERTIRHAAAAEGAVSDKDPGERRYGSGKGNLRPKQVVVDGRVNALDRAVVAVNIGEAAEPGANFVFA